MKTQQCLKKAITTTAPVYFEEKGSKDDNS
jgi:hypothetical protein